MPLSPIPEILDELRAGRMIVLVDDEDRENEGDLCMAAEKVTPAAINFMVKHGRGLVCVPMEAERIDRLALEPQARANTSRHGTAFTVSVDARYGIATGISAADRATTILAMLRPECRPEDLVRPGHVFPLRAEPGGTLVRTGHTEGMVDLCKLAGLQPAGIVCEILNEDGTMARLPDLERFAAPHGLKMTSIAEIIEWRRANERLVERTLSIKLPTRFGEFDVHLYHSIVDRDPHVALTMGLPDPARRAPDAAPIADPILVRVHSSCFTGDLLESLRCDCGDQLHSALAQIGREAKGVLLYMQQEGRGIGLENKLRAYYLQQTAGMNTVEANRALGFPDDVRHYGVGAQILRDLGVQKIRLLTNNPRKYHAIRGYHLEIVERVPIEIAPNDSNRDYLRTKRDKLGHDLRNLPG
jgi:3,4-dihydroxy 2-butanone 4-phosphate synthase/GTP cyclohydrolase II